MIESAKLRALRALLPHVLCALRALVPRVLCTALLHVSRTLRALVLDVHHILHALQGISINYDMQRILMLCYYSVFFS